MRGDGFNITESLGAYEQYAKGIPRLDIHQVPRVI